MEGYEVLTSDESKIGHVVGQQGNYLIVEHGLLIKHRRPVPKTFAHADDSEQVVRVSVSKQIVEGAPKVNGDGLDEQAAAAHYGLAEGVTAPETEGYGELTPDDPGRSAQEDELRLGREPADAQRARTREAGLEPEQSVPGSSPGLLGDRYER